MRRILLLFLLSVPSVAVMCQAADRLPARPKHDVRLPFVAEAVLPGMRMNVSDGCDLVAFAKRFLGCPYAYGATGPDRFDCSGFTQFVFSAAGLKIPRMTESQYLQGMPIERIRDMRPGDLVFFTGSDLSNTWGHVGIVVSVAPDGGSFKFIHAANRGVTVDDSTTAYYRERYVGCSRIPLFVNCK